MAEQAEAGQMTEMVYGSVAPKPGDPVLPRWWRTIDRWALAAILVLFLTGLLLGLAASVPLASRNELAPFHYVYRQIFYGVVALCTLTAISMMSPTGVRRIGVLGFAIAFVAILLLPVLGTDFGKGATRWYSLGFASLQPSEFLKPCFVILAAWMMSASMEVDGPPGKRYSFIIMAVLVVLLALQPDFGQAALVLGAWGVMYFVAGASIILLVLPSPFAHYSA